MGFRNERPHNWRMLNALPRKDFHLGDKIVSIKRQLNGSVFVSVSCGVGICSDILYEPNIFLVKKKIRSLMRIFK